MKIIIFLIIAFGFTLKAISAPKEKSTLRASEKSTSALSDGILYGEDWLLGQIGRDPEVVQLSPCEEGF